MSGVIMVSKTQQQGIELHLATPEDASDMVNFHNSYYGENVQPEHWLWEYQKYEPSKSVFAFAKDHNRLIGTMAWAPIHMMAGGKSVLAGRGENALILPPYRGKRVFMDIVKYAMEQAVTRGMQITWGFTDAARAFERLGFTTYPDIVVFTRPGNIKLEAFSRIKRKAPLRHRVGSVIKLLLRYTFMKDIRTIPEVREREGYEVHKGRIHQLQLEGLYKRLTSRNKNMVYIKPDKKYLSWRVRRHPFFKYDEYQVLQDTELRAYAFVVSSQGTAHISDFLSEDSFATSLLLQTILKDYRKQVARFQLLGNQRDLIAQDLYEQLHRFGFRSFSWILSIGDLTEGKHKHIFDMRNWHITGLWTEGYMC